MMREERLNEIGRALEGRSDAETARELFDALCEMRTTAQIFAMWIRTISLNPDAVHNALAFVDANPL